MAVMQSLFETAHGREPGDLMIRNVRILDVFTERLYPGSLLMKHGRIAAVTDRPELSAKETFDGQDMVALPGFIDAHFHIDSTLVTPAALSAAIVPRGTTTLFAEVLDFAFEHGLDGVKKLLKRREELPYRMFLAAPGKVAPTDVAVEMLNHWEDIASLGELAQKTAEKGETEIFQKILLAREKNKIVSGHVIRTDAQGMDPFAVLGYDDEHNTDTYEETLDRLRFGMKKILRYGSINNGIDPIIRGVVRDGLPTESLMFAADDIYIHDLVRRGHVDNMIQLSIDLGLNPIKAIKIATINAARHFRMDHLLGSVTPGRYGDIVLVESLEKIQPCAVFHNGGLVAMNGTLTAVPDIDYSDLIQDVKPGLQQLDESVFDFGPEDRRTFLYTAGNWDKIQKEPCDIPESAKGVPINLTDDVLPYYRIGRYANGGIRKVERVLLHGFGLKKGAIATFFTQEGQAINVTGTNTEDMLLAVQEVDRHPGGMAVVADGKVLMSFPQPIGGMLSDRNCKEAAAALERLDAVSYTHLQSA